MVKRLLGLIIFFNFSFTYAQTIKTDVLVIGGTASGVAAAIQSARSKVKTVMVEQEARLCATLGDATTVKIETDKNMPSGIWGEFRKRIITHYKQTPGYDTAYNTPLQLEEETGALTLTGIADTVKNLSIELNKTFTGIIKDGDRWDVTVTQNGKTEIIKARVVVDATEDANVIGKAGAEYLGFNSYKNMTEATSYRTSIATTTFSPPSSATELDNIGYNYPPSPTCYIPVKAMLAKGADNLLVTERVFKLHSDLDYLPIQLAAGQGAGVIAAYCAFFKTTTNNLRVRAIQTELLDFKGYLLPFEDTGNDPQWRAIQQVCATGMLKGVQKTVDGKQEFIFDPDFTVTTDEIKPVMLEIYTRAFLWFRKEKPGKDFTIGNLLSFISEITLNDPVTLQKTLARNWKKQYKFNSDFDMDRPITRREFAILTNQYLNPFARTVDLDGKVVN